MDKLTRYIFDYYYNLLTVEEQAAYKSILGRLKIESAEGPKAQEMVRRFWVSSDPKVQALLANGEEAFMDTVRDRVLRERHDEVFINLCPRCGALAHTPRAKQCPKCCLSWHGDA